jgi:hypothetical protein
MNDDRYPFEIHKAFVARNEVSRIRVFRRNVVVLPPCGAWRLHWPWLALLASDAAGAAGRCCTPACLMTRTPDPNWALPCHLGDVPIAGTFSGREPRGLKPKKLCLTRSTATDGSTRGRAVRACSHPNTDGAGP